jgi:hypothetical protein
MIDSTLRGYGEGEAVDGAHGDLSAGRDGSRALGEGGLPYLSADFYLADGGVAETGVVLR